MMGVPAWLPRSLHALQQQAVLSGPLAVQREPLPANHCGGDTASLTCTILLPLLPPCAQMSWLGQRRPEGDRAEYEIPPAGGWWA